MKLIHTLTNEVEGVANVWHYDGKSIRFIFKEWTG